MRPRTVFLHAVLILSVPDVIVAGGPAPPPPVDESFFKQQAAIILDGNRTPAERAQAILAFESRCGVVDSVAPRMDRMLKELAKSENEALVVRIAAAYGIAGGYSHWADEKTRESRKEWCRLASPLIHEALASDDESVHGVLFRVHGLFGPAAALRALQHDSPTVRLAGLHAVRSRLKGKLSDRSAELFRPILRDTANWREWRTGVVLSLISNDTGAFDDELAGIASCEAIAHRDRCEALALVRRRFTTREIDYAVERFPLLGYRETAKRSRIIREAGLAGSRRHLETMLAFCRSEKGSHLFYRSEIEKMVLDALGSPPSEKPRAEKSEGR